MSKTHRLKFEQLSTVEVMGIMAQAPAKDHLPHLVLMVQVKLEEDSLKGFLIFELKNLCEIKPGLDFSQMELIFTQEQLPNLSPIMQFDKLTPVTNLNSTLRLNSKKLIYRGIHTGKNWFESERFQCFNVLGFQVGDIWLQWYYRRSMMAPQFVTDWVVADLRPFSTPVPVIITDERCSSPIAYLSNNVISSGGVLEMILAANDFRHQPFRIEGTWETIKEILDKGRAARDSFYAKLESSHLLPKLPFYIKISTEFPEEIKEDTGDLD